MRAFVAFSQHQLATSVTLGSLSFWVNRSPADNGRGMGERWEWEGV